MQIKIKFELLDFSIDMNLLDYDVELGGGMKQTGYPIHSSLIRG